MLNAVDRREVVLLDLSAAFDTIDHKFLINRLQHRIGLSGNVLQWVCTYLKCRSSRVFIDDCYSQSYPLMSGVPQGSVIGPLMFIIYTLPIGDIIRKHNVCFHAYADDKQLYDSFNPNTVGAAEMSLQKLQGCISELQSWMNPNKLKLNSDKTEFFIAGSIHSLKKLPNLELKVGDHVIRPSPNVRNLGVVFDNKMSMTKQVNSIISSAYLQLRNIKRIQRYLDKDTKHHVVRALILSRLDYANSLLYGLKSQDLRRLQSIQNKAAKLIFSVPRLTNPVPLLNKLHWLPIQNRIKFKLCLLIYKCLNESAPTYLINEISLKPALSSGAVTRSAQDKTLLVIPACKKSIGDKAFAVAGPSIWNRLPQSVREAKSVNQFKKLLKTHLF